MLYNLAIALQRHNKTADLRDVYQYGLTLPFDPEIHRSFHAWSAFEELCVGNTAAAKEHLASTSETDLPHDLKWIYAFNHAMIEVQEAKPAVSLKTFNAARKTLKSKSDGWILKQKKYTRRFYWRAVRRIGHDCGSLVPLIWGAWHQFGLLTVSLPTAIVSAFLQFNNPEVAPLFLFSMIFSIVYYSYKDR